MERLSDTISRMTFAMNKRGYDTTEVDAFVDTLVAKVARLEDELAATYGKLNVFERSVDAGKDAGLVVQDAFRVATARRDEIIAEAEARAAAIVAEAESTVRQRVPADPRVAEMESEVILSRAKEDAGKIVASAERRAREILRVARAGASEEAESALAEARERAAMAKVEYDRIVEQLRKLKESVNRMLQDGAGGSEEIRLVFAGDR